MHTHAALGAVRADTSPSTRGVIGVRLGVLGDEPLDKLDGIRQWRLLDRLGLKLCVYPRHEALKLLEQRIQCGFTSAWQAPVDVEGSLDRLRRGHRQGELLDELLLALPCLLGSDCDQ